MLSTCWIWIASSRRPVIVPAFSMSCFTMHCPQASNAQTILRANRIYFGHGLSVAWSSSPNSRVYVPRSQPSRYILKRSPDLETDVVFLLTCSVVIECRTGTKSKVTWLNCAPMHRDILSWYNQLWLFRQTAIARQLFLLLNSDYITCAT